MTRDCKYPLLAADLNKLRHNLDALVSACHARGVSVAAVTKVVCAHEAFVRLVEESGADLFADSRLENLARIQTEKQRMLLRVAAACEADAVVRTADISLQSEITTIRLLDAAAGRAGKTHQVVLMIDLGDLREGLYVADYDAIERTAREAAGLKSIELIGVGANLTCFGAILPDEQNLGALVDVARRLRSALGLELPIVSGGNSSTVGLLLAGGVPDGITNLRLGESILLGNDTAALTVLPGLYGDAFTLRAQLVEVQEKPAAPVGTSGANAFGERVTFPKTGGTMLRGILAIGRQDVDETGLFPRDLRVRVIGASSDHLLVDLSHVPHYRVGDVLEFSVSYGALLRLSTSPYVEKVYR